MARRLNMILLVLMAAAALLQSSAAETTHVVGGTMGWTIPQGGAADYTAWAANQTFTVGDTLVFNFTTGVHDVAEVTKAAFDACNSANPISIETNGPATLTLDAAGEHYFICTFTRHCGLGQLLAINVTTPASSPAPQPSTPPPAPAPAPAHVPTPSPGHQPSTPPPASAPTPSPAHAPSTPPPASAPAPVPARAPMTYEVGDALGWTVPPNGAIAYQAWASNKTFTVGDTLVFNFTSGVHDVAEVTKAAYDTCNTTTTISRETTGPARITLTTAGEHFYICTFPRHCSLGQLLAINVTGSSSATPPSSSTTPTTPSTPAPEGTTATPPTPGNHAASFATAGFFGTFLSIAVALLF